MKHLRSITSSSTPAMESIRFQDGSFFRDLTAILEPYVTGKIPTRNERETLTKNISSVIKKYTKLNVQGQWSNTYAISIADWFKDHVLFEQYKSVLTEEDSNALIAKSKKEAISGTVDLINAQVSGFYAEQSFTLLIDATWFVNSRLTAKHHAAVILHEVGHAFTMCEMIDRVVMTNQILTRMQAELLGTDAVKRKTTIQKAGRALKLNEQVIESASNSANTEVATTVLLTGLMKEGRTNTASPYYNVSTAEQMADEFATRMGAGPYLIETLDIVGLNGGQVQKRTAAAYYVMEFIKTTLMISGFAFLPVLIISLFWMFSESTDSGGHYDTPHDRIKRVRNQIIQGMKNFNATKEVVKDYQEQLELADAVLTQYTNRQQWWGIVFDYLGNYTGVKDRDFQQKLEALASNELFSGALSIKHM